LATTGCEYDCRVTLNLEHTATSPTKKQSIVPRRDHQILNRLTSMMHLIFVAFVISSMITPPDTVSCSQTGYIYCISACSWSSPDKSIKCRYTTAFIVHHPLCTSSYTFNLSLLICISESISLFDDKVSVASSTNTFIHQYLHSIKRTTFTPSSRHGFLPTFVESRRSHRARCQMSSHPTVGSWCADDNVAPESSASRYKQ